MSTSGEALDLDGRKGRKEGEKRMIQSRRSSSTAMSNDEIQVSKKVERSTPRKGKAVEIVRQRSDLGIKKSPPQIKRARSATISAKDETGLVKLRKIKSDSAKVAENSLLPLKLGDPKEDLEIEKSRFEEEEEEDNNNNGQVKAIKNNAENQDLDLDLEEEEEEEAEVEVEVEKEIEENVEIKDIVISLEEEKKKPNNFIIEEKNLIPIKDRSPPIAAVNHARNQEKLTPSNPLLPIFSDFFSLNNIFCC